MKQNYFNEKTRKYCPNKAYTFFLKKYGKHEELYTEEQNELLILLQVLRRDFPKQIDYDEILEQQEMIAKSMKLEHTFNLLEI